MTLLHSFCRKIKLPMRIPRAMFLAAFLFSLGFSQTKSDTRTGTYLTRAMFSQSASSIRVTANSPRPLPQILDALQQKYGWAVDYEDPQYVSKLDLIEAHTPSRSLLPSGGSFSVEFPAGAPLVENTLRLLVDSYNQSKNPGRFELRKTAQGGYAVVGTAAYDEKGKILQRLPLLDSPITVPAKERTITDTIALICQEAGAVSQSPVNIGVAPTGFLDHASVTVGGNNVRARDLLLQTLMATHRSLYWRLLFDPNSKSYYLDIHAAEPS